MTTLRPQMIRAGDFSRPDTLDLQDHETPSAQDHTHQPFHPEPLGAGPPAPHQEHSLRQIQEERSAEQEYLADAWGSGRSSHEGSDLLNDADPDDELRISTDDSTLLDDSNMHVNGGEAADSPDKDGEEGVDDDMEDRVSSSPSIPDDEAADLREGFVWALHNFIATVEGQANATKGDVMVLLDDSNSYWWLVRVVKDSSIGYLPAEHIETAQERLARYNKHRNLEVAQAMLTDTQERSKNPLKKAMRRRNAKSVQFSTPIFYEPPSELDWSDVEGDEDQEDENALAEATAETQGADQIARGDEIESAGYKSNGQPSDESGLSAEIENSVHAQADNSRTALESSRPDTESLEQPAGANPGRSRNGTMRNTDSFFNDDTAEPRKISLTPNLLRDESNENVSRNGSVTERASASQDSFELLDKSSPTSEKDKVKEDRKKKEKKSGMLSGLFKRKDKKIKVDEAAGGVALKQEGESGSPILTPGDSGSPTGGTSPTSPQSPQQAKKPPSSGKVAKSPSGSGSRQTNGSSRAAADTAPTSGMATSGPEFSRQAEDDAMDLEPRPGQVVGERTEPLQDVTDTGDSHTQMTARQQGSITSSSSTPPDSRSVASKEIAQATGRSGDLGQERAAPLIGPHPGILRNSEKILQNDFNTSGSSLDSTNANEPSRNNYNLNSSARFPIPDLSAPPDRNHSTVANEPRVAGASDSLPRSAQNVAESFSTPTASSSSSSATASAPAREPSDEAWNGVALKAYLDGQSNDDAKNMLILIHNQTDVNPLPLDHPTMLALGYHEQQKRLNEMSAQLDGLLQGFLARRAARPKTTQR